MNVKKCDRCGGIYDCEKGGFVLIADKKERRRDNVFYITYNGENVEQRDLCRNCLDNFKNWFEQKDFDEQEKPVKEGADIVL